MEEPIFLPPMVYHLDRIDTERELLCPLLFAGFTSSDTYYVSLVATKRKRYVHVPRHRPEGKNIVGAASDYYQCFFLFSIGSSSVRYLSMVSNID